MKEDAILELFVNNLSFVGRICAGQGFAGQTVLVKPGLLITALVKANDKACAGQISAGVLLLSECSVNGYWPFLCLSVLNIPNMILSQINGGRCKPGYSW